MCQTKYSLKFVPSYLILEETLLPAATAAEDPRLYFAMSMPGDTRDALSDITNITGMLSI